MQGTRVEQAERVTASPSDPAAQTRACFVRRSVPEFLATPVRPDVEYLLHLGLAVKAVEGEVRVEVFQNGAPVFVIARQGDWLVWDKVGLPPSLISDRDFHRCFEGRPLFDKT